MGRARKAQRRRELEHGLAKVIRYDEALDDPGHFENAAPLYGEDLLPWEQPIIGFEMAHEQDVVNPGLIPSASHDIGAQVSVGNGSRSPDMDADDRRCTVTTHRSSKPHITLKSDQIRVLELAPGSNDGPLYGSFIPVTLQSDLSVLIAQHDLDNRTAIIDFGIRADLGTKVQYTAISYCWGSDNGLQHQLTISGRALPVSSVVATVLRAVRHQEHAVRLWLDQICIDQDNREDKESQIKLMSLIYRRAYNTLIWLGDSPEDGAFHLLQSLAYNLWGVKNDDANWQEAFKPMIAHRGKALRALMKLFQSTWFTRTWIVQEVALSWKPYIWYGSRTMSCDNFTAAAVYLEEFDMSSLSDLDEHEKLLSTGGIKNMRRLDSIRLQCLISDPDAFRLHSLLRDTRSADVTLPADKVYGIMALCDGVVPVDYSQPVANVFKDTATEILMQRNLADILSDVDHDCDERESPSWVVDWSKKRRTTPLHTSTHRAHQKAGVSPVINRTVAQSGSSALTAKMLFIDDLEDMSEVVIDAQLTNINPKQSNIALRQLVEFVGKHWSLRQKHIDFATFCSTIVAGQDETGLRVFPEKYVEILSLLCDETTGRSPSLPGQIYSPRQREGRLSLDSLLYRQPKRTLQEVKMAFSNALLNRRLAFSQQGDLVLVPSYARTGDAICIVAGCSVPCILRKCGDKQYALLGECYLHRLMDGEYFEERADDLMDIEIV